MTQAHGMLKAALVGASRGRAPKDFYATPPKAVEALLPDIADFPRTIWEPACGDGAMARELERGGYTVIGTDLVNRGYGYLDGGVDFLKTSSRLADAIVTNPPFGGLAAKFIKHAVLTLRVPFAAFLINTNFWHAELYSKIFDARRPSAVLPLTWRLDFTGTGRPYFNCMWTVWRPTSPADPIYRRLPKPVDIFA
jgi:hypothetical protein